MELRDMRVFAAVATAGSISGAARELHLSQSAVSQTVQRVEREIGSPVLERGRDGVRQTPVGRRLAEAVDVVLSTYDRLIPPLSEPAGPTALRLGVPLEFPSERLTAALRRWSAQCPDRTIDIQHSSSGSQLSALDAGRLDVALIRERTLDPGYDAVLAAEEPLGVVLAEQLAPDDPSGGPVALESLAALRWVSFARAESPAWWDQISATMRAHGIAVRLKDDDHPMTAEVKLAAVATGRAFALAPAGWAAPLPTGVGWRRLRGDPLVRRTWAVWRSASTSRDVAALVGALDLEAEADRDDGGI